MERLRDVGGVDVAVVGVAVLAVARLQRRQEGRQTRDGDLTPSMSTVSIRRGARVINISVSISVCL